MSPTDTRASENVDNSLDITRKRASSAANESPVNKRLRLLPPHSTQQPEANGIAHEATGMITSGEVARAGIRRGIALALDQVGFEGATEEALESFTSIVDTYMQSFGEEIRAFTNAARRQYSEPTDVELVLRRFNLTTSSLKPHIRPPVPRSKRRPKWKDLPIAEHAGISLPVLDPELSGQAEKESRTHIPPAFPPFPSIHTYRSTPVVREFSPTRDERGQSSLDLATQSITQSQIQSGTQTQTHHRPLAPSEIPRGDPKKMREAAAKEATYGEAALRRLVRASKIAKQKEVWTTAMKEPPRRIRYELWETSMRDMLEDEAMVQGREVDSGAVHGASGRFEIADHSTIVNADGRFHRKEVQRTGTRKHIGSGELGLGKA